MTDTTNTISSNDKLTEYMTKKRDKSMKDREIINTRLNILNNVQQENLYRKKKIYIYISLILLLVLILFSSFIYKIKK